MGFADSIEYPAWDEMHQGFVSLTFHEFSKNILVKIYNTRNHICGRNFKLKFCICTQSVALGTSIKFQLEILMRSMISAIHKFRENILESFRNISETPPRNKGL